MIFTHGDWGLSTIESTSFNLGKFQICVSSSAQVLLRPNFGVFFPGPLACLPFWLEAQLLSQVCNCSQINHGPGYRWPAVRPRHGLAWPNWSHSGQRSRCWGDSQSQPGLHSQGDMKSKVMMKEAEKVQLLKTMLKIQITQMMPLSLSQINVQSQAALGDRLCW